MPKNKTHSGSKKRFTVTNGGKIKKGKLNREQANQRHLLEGKASKRMRRLAGDKDVAPADVSRIRRLLGI
jgi:large subunit ribosomal protein L35